LIDAPDNKAEMRADQDAICMAELVEWDSDEDMEDLEFDLLDTADDMLDPTADVHLKKTDVPLKGPKCWDDLVEVLVPLLKEDGPPPEEGEEEDKMTISKLRHQTDRDVEGRGYKRFVSNAKEWEELHEEWLDQQHKRRREKAKGTIHGCVKAMASQKELKSICGAQGLWEMAARPDNHILMGDSTVKQMLGVLNATQSYETRLCVSGSIFCVWETILEKHSSLRKVLAWVMDQLCTCIRTVCPPEHTIDPPKPPMTDEEMIAAAKEDAARHEKNAGKKKPTPLTAEQQARKEHCDHRTLIAVCGALACMAAEDKDVRLLLGTEERLAALLMACRHTRHAMDAIVHCLDWPASKGTSGHRGASMLRLIRARSASANDGLGGDGIAALVQLLKDGCVREEDDAEMRVGAMALICLMAKTQYVSLMALTPGLWQALRHCIFEVGGQLVAEATKLSAHLRAQKNWGKARKGVMAARAAFRMGKHHEDDDSDPALAVDHSRPDRKMRLQARHGKDVAVLNDLLRFCSTAMFGLSYSTMLVAAARGGFSNHGDDIATRVMKEHIQVLEDEAPEEIHPGPPVPECAPSSGTGADVLFGGGGDGGGGGGDGGGGAAAALTGFELELLMPVGGGNLHPKGGEAAEGGEEDAEKKKPKTKPKKKGKKGDAPPGPRVGVNGEDLHRLCMMALWNQSMRAHGGAHTGIVVCAASSLACLAHSGAEMAAFMMRAHDGELINGIGRVTQVGSKRLRTIAAETIVGLAKHEANLEALWAARVPPAPMELMSLSAQRKRQQVRGRPPPQRLIELVAEGMKLPRAYALHGHCAAALMLCTRDAGLVSRGTMERLGGKGEGAPVPPDGSRRVAHIISRVPDRTLQLPHSVLNLVVVGYRLRNLNLLGFVSVSVFQLAIHRPNRRLLSELGATVLCLRWIATLMLAENGSLADPPPPDKEAGDAEEQDKEDEDSEDEDDEDAEARRQANLPHQQFKALLKAPEQITQLQEYNLGALWMLMYDGQTREDGHPLDAEELHYSDSEEEHCPQKAAEAEGIHGLRRGSAGDGGLKKPRVKVPRRRPDDHHGFDPMNDPTGSYSTAPGRCNADTFLAAGGLSILQDVVRTYVLPRQQPSRVSALAALWAACDHSAACRVAAVGRHLLLDQLIELLHDERSAPVQLRFLAAKFLNCLLKEPLFQPTLQDQISKAEQRAQQRETEQREKEAQQKLKEVRRGSAQMQAAMAAAAVANQPTGYDEAQAAIEANVPGPRYDESALPRCREAVRKVRLRHSNCTI
jgi:hypothetical protein